jgi:hypothetical protein
LELVLFGKGEFSHQYVEVMNKTGKLLSVSVGWLLMQISLWDQMLLELAAGFVFDSSFLALFSSEVDDAML